MKCKTYEVVKKCEIKKEKGNLYSINIPDFGIKYFNEQGKFILEYLYKEMDLANIILKIESNDKVKNDTEIRKDLFAFLSDLKSTKIIDFDTQLMLNELKIDLYQEIGVAGESTYSLIAQSIRKFIQNGQAIIMTEQQKGNYNDYSFRLRCFAHKEICYFGKSNDGNEISSILCVENMESSNRVVNITLIVYGEEEQYSKLMATMIADAKYWNKRKVRISITQNRINENLLRFLENNEFEKEAVLSEESIDGDMYIFTKWI